MSSIVGKYIIIVGAVLLGIGLIVYFFGDKLNWPGLDWPGLDWLGRLPGDIRIDGKDGGGFYFPIVTCIVLSILLNVIIGLIRRFFGP